MCVCVCVCVYREGERIKCTTPNDDFSCRDSPADTIKGQRL